MKSASAGGVAITQKSRCVQKCMCSAHHLGRECIEHSMPKPTCGRTVTPPAISRTVNGIPAFILLT